MLGLHVIDKFVQLEVTRPGAETVAPTAQLDASLVEQHAFRSRNGADTQVEVQCAGQPLRLALYLLEQYRADRARPDQPDRQRLRRQVEARVHGAQRTHGVAVVDDRRDISLRRTLCNGAHVDAGAAETAEYLGCHAGCAGHAVTDDGENAAAGRDIDRMDLAGVQFGAKRGLDDTPHARRFGIGHGKADRVLGTAL